MMKNTSNMHLPFLTAAQSQKHVTVNEALSKIDAMFSISIQSFDHASPPDGPQEGQFFHVSAGAIGEFAGKDGSLAFILNGAWEFVAPKPGWIIYNIETQQVLCLNNSGHWFMIGAGATT
jgi:hypothetical protein